MSGILTDPDLNAPARRKPSYPKQAADLGMVVRHRTSGTIGHIIQFDPNWTTLRDEHGREHRLRTEAGAFSVRGQTVDLVRPAVKKEHKIQRTASGSVAVPNAPARMARASRLVVEGQHDAELIEKVWGDDLRLEGVVVEVMHGADDIAEYVRGFGPKPGRKLAMLLDHLVPGTKEWHLAMEVTDPHVLIAGHPFVDVWETIKPETIGIKSWPVIEKGTDWKTGICHAWGTDDETGLVWKRLLGQVKTYADLEPSMVRAVEEMIDFVTAPTRT